MALAAMAIEATAAVATIEAMAVDTATATIVTPILPMVVIPTATAIEIVPWTAINSVASGETAAILETETTATIVVPATIGAETERNVTGDVVLETSGVETEDVANEGEEEVIEAAFTFTPTEKNAPGWKTVVENAAPGSRCSTLSQRQNKRRWTRLVPRWRGIIYFVREGSLLRR